MFYISQYVKNQTKIIYLETNRTNVTNHKNKKLVVNGGRLQLSPSITANSMFFNTTNIETNFENLFDFQFFSIFAIAEIPFTV